MTKRWLLILLFSSSGYAQDQTTQLLIEQDQLIKEIQRDLRQLRGEYEQLQHQLKILQQNQQDIQKRFAGATNTSPTLPPTTIEKPTPPVLPSPPLSAPSASPPTALPEYQQAFDWLQRGQLDKAILAFEAFVKQSPTGDYADSAHYWLGEAYYAKRDFVSALATFKKLVDNYPDSPHKPHALLKIGFSYNELGDNSSARQVLEQLRQTFPHTLVARLAEERLHKLR